MSVMAPGGEYTSTSDAPLGLPIVGSGQGSVPTRDVLAELPDLAAEIARGIFQIDARAVSLGEVETVGNDTGNSQRIVLTP